MTATPLVTGRIIAKIAMGLAAVALIATIPIGCARLPDISDRIASARFEDTNDTPLGRAVVPIAQMHAGKSGVVALADGRDAFAARALLTNAAVRSIDLQYYIWETDVSCKLLYEALHRAADRGVRVRVLLDDNRTAGHDTFIASLDAHPAIEIRLFNPFKYRQWRVLDYIFDFSRINRWMHNKTFTVDNQATIIGGRNVGDEYFGAHQESVMYDLDALAIGHVVSEVSKDFDRYWNCESSYPVSVMLANVDKQLLSDLRDATVAAEREPAARKYVESLAKQPFVRALLRRELPLDWADTQLVSDDPAKVFNEASDDPLLWAQVRQLMGKPVSEMQLISPYLVPQAQGVEFLRHTAQSGVTVQVLTNSLEATDVAAVHAGYAKWRKPLLESGVRLFELRRDSSTPVTTAEGSFGSSSSTLHAKSFAIDRARVFIGSFNFDPRSAELNTEVGFVIESAELAGKISGLFAESVPERSYEVQLSANGKDLQWIERRNGQEIIHQEEPGSSYVRWAVVSVLSVLPIDWML